MPDFRIDRTVSLGLIRLLGKSRGQRQKPRIPILMYHGIHDNVASGHPYYATHTSPSVFATQMQHLHEAGYRTIGLDEVVRVIEGQSDAAKTVAITFDDGYRDFLTDALPVLASYGFIATVFIVSDFASGNLPTSERERYMNWNEVREILSLGMHIGSHTQTHPELRHLHPEQITAELSASKTSIEEQIDCPIQSFSYPYAFPEHDAGFFRSIREQLQAFGYQNAVSTIIGSACRQNDRYLLPRLPVNAHDDSRLFAAKLEGAYDWMHTAQSARKRFERPLKSGALYSTR